MGKLEIKDLYVEIEGKEILNGINLTIGDGEVHALMGPNGVGKTSLSYTIAGHPKYKVTKGDILFDEQSILSMKADERAKLGLFLAFQHPVEIQGVSLAHFLYAVNKIKGNGMNVLEFRKVLDGNAKLIGVDSSFLNRQLNVGFSGGEKKRAEVLQMLVNKPKFAVLDEVDSGTDLDSMKVLGTVLNNMKGKGFGALVVTHYKRILSYLNPDFIHVLMDGKIVLTGDNKLADELEDKGYSWLQEKGVN